LLATSTASPSPTPFRSQVLVSPFTFFTSCRLTQPSQRTQVFRKGWSVADRKDAPAAILKNGFQAVDVRTDHRQVSAHTLQQRKRDRKSSSQHSSHVKSS